MQLIKSALEASMRLGVQFILLGSCGGDERVREEWEATAAAAAKTSSTRVILADNDSLARLMYAGLDCLVVPSLSEPCGLTQVANKLLYSLTFGSMLEELLLQFYFSYL